jgi:hypothetical protein
MAGLPGFWEVKMDFTGEEVWEGERHTPRKFGRESERKRSLSLSRALRVLG